MPSMKPVIYVIRNPAGDEYVGSTTDFSNRRTNHKRDLRRGTGVNKKVQRSWDTYGEHGHTFEVVATVLDHRFMHMVEADVIRGISPTLNVNLTPNAVYLPTTAPPNPTKLECLASGVSYACFRARERKGWSRDEALGKTKRSKTESPLLKKVFVTVGTETKTLDAWASATGTKKPTIASRLARGYPVEQAVGLVPTDKVANAREQERRKQARKDAATYTVRGFSGSLAQIAANFGLQPSVVYARKSLHWPEDMWAAPLYARGFGCVAPTEEQKTERVMQERDDRAFFAGLVDEFMEEV